MKQFYRMIFLIMIVIVFQSSIFPQKANCAGWEYGGQIISGFGYTDNAYIEKNIKKYKQMTSAYGYNISRIKDFGDSLYALSFIFNLRLFYGKNFGFGISSGLIGISNNAEIYYRRNVSTGPFNRDIKSPGSIAIQSLMLPQSFNLYYRLNISNNFNIIIGAGPGDYIINTNSKRKIDVKKICQNNGNTNIDTDDMTSYMYIKNMHSINHNPGANAIIEFSFMYGEHLSFDLGFQGHYILTNSRPTPSLHAYLGLTERVFSFSGI